MVILQITASGLQACQLFSPVALIQKRSGHRSTEALCLYETRGVNSKHLQTISNILAGAI